MVIPPDVTVLIEESFVFVGVLTAIGCATAVLTEWIKYRHRNGLGKDAGKQLDQIAERLARLDTAMDAVSIEVERISEAQRFTSKLLADRPAAAAPAPAAALERPRAPGSTTPH